MQAPLGSSKEYRIIQRKPNTNWNVWWRLLRPHTLTASFVPVFIGTALALLTGPINIYLFLTMLLACILIQAATNMFNEYYDFKRGLDTAESVGIGGTIVRDGVTPKFVFYLAIAFLALATLLGVYICANSSWWIALIGIVCMAVGYLYTGGPYPIAYTPFGELFAGLFMGLIIILISFFIHTGTVTLDSVLVSVPSTILIGAILMANNIRDLDGDKKNGRHTLAIILGRNNAVKFLAGMFIFSYIWTCFLVYRLQSPWLLLVFASIPKAFNAVKGFQGKTLPIEMMPAMKATAETNTSYGFLLTIGLIIGYFL
ncbi:MAG: 1,4-dihydroxy-2-naphthoate polyprenyltransferase [Clostridia bacterium]|nr:1,4-dihydroxy-2-naphthoate polyprenyltransferase [Clostridia bacterium]